MLLRFATPTCAGLADVALLRIAAAALAQPLAWNQQQVTE